MEDIKLLGKRIGELRKTKGFTQDALSELVGIDPKHLSRIECGKNRPSLELLYKISSVLKVDLALFFQNNHNIHKNGSRSARPIPVRLNQQLISQLIIGFYYLRIMLESYRDNNTAFNKRTV